MGSAVLRVILLGLLTISYSSSLPLDNFDDDCSPSVTSMNRGPLAIELLKDCSKGAVQWNYPTDSLTVVFPDLTPGDKVGLNSTFRLNAIVSCKVKPYNITINNVPTFVPARSNELVISFLAPPELYYLNMIDYNIYRQLDKTK